ncbi:MAG: thiazole synthase [Candidatus Raymondbacteria bacterium RifOxyC12_full_50_8]|uniref:Thiazole synthase n=1 Tax=Candidatus Raymondbacteria bacterium RIFOXYD12_FULL_49_13 TaxID=1817890 RepID=A0A1F7FC73_UNCRA|nr:MAG: thiazole synthase [Candidatus Raymondbacteria bacterium RIFOXYA2_FULL_49_16]OGJ93455.1 MAG: thiazole synthase [Candidatus Raymondbacteria bacterium RifOxyB12_full_50_8]OGK04285.1 MAG: thiazole synthase [Candidatus Raymondbacteria bacterium RIFOXYD12_FULL_49_13]OGK07981.1 MAG: thiazole synthase [Candidatus Raymondbacteria bacterium RifOxyC12_full_50_8]OGP42431.1 MAG: thiazole synthase [Candidatus Raymondbacteria bacterium RIFOXYB2_FULL_49_35]
MDSLAIAGRTVRSRLITGSGKYQDEALIPAILAAAECDIITVALRRVDFDRPADNILRHIPEGKILLPNTSGARNADEAVRIAHLSRAMGCGDWIKVEVINDQKYLLPDNAETIRATEILAREGFIVLPYMSPDLAAARSLVRAGAAAIMPLGSPIGSNQGLKTLSLLEIMIAEIDLPIIIDAGIGAPSHAAQAMEIGADAVLLNTAIATSDNPVLMAEAFKHAVRAGRLAYLAGCGPVSSGAQPSSPLTGFLHS